MQIFIVLLNFLIQPQGVIGQGFQLLNPEEQIRTINVVINDQNYQSEEDAFIYAMWSRYTPLTQIAQVGRIGLFDSNCFKYHHFAGKKTKYINLVFYVCLDPQQSTITQTLQFKDDENKDHIYNVAIDPNQFENVWYYFQIVQWPLLDQLQILIMESQRQLLFEEIKIKYPFYDKELIATFGGGADFVYDTQKMVYSFFPGQIIIVPPDIGQYDPSDDADFSYFEDLENKNFCYENSESEVINHAIIKGNEFLVFPSSEKNTDFFQFVGWLKITSLVGDEIYYKAIKITTNTKNSKVTDDNLSPFCLFYKFSSSGNKIIITTYSYDFPIINVDFSKNPFLIQKELELPKNIYVWHYVSVTLQNKQLDIQITFYDEYQNFEQETTISVQQFHLINFQIQIGNLEERIDSYLNFIANEVYFSNCDTLQFEEACHYSCQQCIGPTSSDCISCDPDSERIFLPHLHQCICPYYSIDEMQCRTLQNLNLSVEPTENSNQECDYGYFEVNQQCFVCPDIINDQQINCLECLNNPKTWIDMLFCQTYIVSQEGQTFQQYEEVQNVYLNTIQYFTFDGVQVHFCQNCTSSCLDQECLYEDFQQTKKQKKFKKQTTCQGCIAECQQNCAYCKSGLCWACYPPYYLTSDKLACKECTINNCQYCFEYRKDDLTESTLYKTFKAFTSNDQSQVYLGCALCFEGFNYNFITGKCVYGQPNINNCGRSYINLEGIEVCTLSKIDDFNVAPQLSNCEQYISNCKQCVLTPTQVIKCVLCSDGFSVSVIKGNCEICNIEYSQTCIQGDASLNDYWVQSIQSFMMQFLPDNYFYPQPILVFYVIAYPLSCIAGYMPTKNYDCTKYCDSDCLLCEEVDFQFVCKDCPLNYYGQPILSRLDNQCLLCPQLCFTCQPRSTEEISALNPYFVTTQDNIMFSYRCLKAIDEEKVVVDSKIQIAKYCFDNICDGSYERQITIYCNNYEGLDDENYDIYYQNDVSVQFYNQMGIKSFILTLIFQQGSWCDISYVLELTTILKQLVFSLQKTTINLIGLTYFETQWSSGLEIINFDSVQMKNFDLLSNPETIISIENDVLPIDLMIFDSIFQGQQTQSNLFRFVIPLNKNLIIRNFTLQYLNLSNLTFMEYRSNYDEDNIDIAELIIKDCNFENVTLLSFLQYSKQIKVSNLTIKDSIFLSSTLIQYNQNNNTSTLDTIVILNCQFISSTLFVSANQPLHFKSMILINNNLHNTTVIQSYTQITVNQVEISATIFNQSLFFQQIKQLDFPIALTFENFNLKQAFFYKAKLIEVQRDVKNTLQVSILNFTHENCVNLGNTQEFLFDIQCQNLSITDLSIINSQNLSFIRVYQTNEIFVQNIYYSSQVQSNRIFIDQYCSYQQNIYSNLLFVQGLSIITIRNISVINQLAIDFPIVYIQSDLLYQPSSQETIRISEIYYYGNILLKKSIGSILSLFAIYSERTQSISLNNFTFQENFFHQQIDDSSESISGLIYVNSKLSDLLLINITCFENGITNSSNPFIYVNTLKIIIENFQVNQSNWLQDQIWVNYYKINSVDHGVIQFLMEQLFIINSGGICQIQSQNFSISNSQFTKVKALSTSILNIIPQGQGIIKLLNLSISQASVGLSQTIEVSGCIVINSKNSKLNLQVMNLRLEEVYNRLGSAIFTISPSLLLNEIAIFNISIVNCFSLLNQILEIEFSQIQAKRNQFKLQQMTFRQTTEGLNQYLQQIIFPSTEEIKKMTNDNALLNLQQCSVILNQIHITGILYSSIFKLNYLTKLRMQNLVIVNIQVLYPLILGIISPTQLFKNNLLVWDILVLNISQIYSDFNLQPEAYLQSINFTFKYCIVDEIEVNQFQNNQTIDNLIQLIDQNQQNEGSIIQFQALSNLSYLRINNIKIFNNHCIFCYGILQIKNIAFPSVIIEDMQCQNNFIKQFGCLQFSTDTYLENLENTIQIRNSVFIKNNGTSGVGIYSQNVLISVIKCVFQKNYGTQKGGAIYFQNVTNQFYFNETIITDNQANIGGGIHLSEKNYLTQYNFKLCLLLFNQATLYSDNLVEIPAHLTLIINKKEMASNKSENNSQYLSIKPYKCIDQGKSILTDKLMLPSNQIIKKYQLFNSKQRVYLPYIQQLNLIYKNSMNELLEGDLDDKCSILKLTSIQSQTNIELINEVFYNPQVVGFDIGDISAQLDPYMQVTNSFQLQVNCSSYGYNKEFYYKMNVSSFTCQLGEFYVDSGCQICDPKQGFYSVTYNTTKCSIFDTTKLDNITSNLIKLKIGYWRPFYDIDQIESCFKNQNWCLGGWSVKDDLCYAGHIGGLCEECDIYNIRGFGKYFKITNTICQICNISFSWVSFILIAIWYISFQTRSFTSVLITLKSLRNSNSLFLKLKLKTKFFLIVFKQSQDFQSILFKMFLNYLWIFSVIFTFNISFNVSLNLIDQASKPTYSMAINLDCILSEIIDIKLIYIRIIAMLIFIMIQLILIALVQLVISIKGKENYDCSMISNTVIYLFVFNQASLITQFGSLLAIRTITGIDYVQGDVTMYFYDQNHLDWIYIFLLPGLAIWGVFFPFMIFYLLKQGKRLLNQYRFRRHVCYLYNEYIGEKYFWEQIKIWKRSIIIIILVYFESNVSTKAFLISLTLLLYQFLAIHNQPYITKKLNSYDVKSGQIVSGTIFLAALKYISEQKDQSLLQENVFIVSIILQLLIFLLCLWLCYYFMVAIMKAYLKKYDLFILTSLYNIISKIKKNSKSALYLADLISMKKIRKEQLQANFEKLRQYLLLTSKFQLEQLRNISPLRSKRHIRLLTEMDTQRMLLHSKSTFSPKDLK